MQTSFISILQLAPAFGLHATKHRATAQTAMRAIRLMSETDPNRDGGLVPSFFHDRCRSDRLSARAGLAAGGRWGRAMGWGGGCLPIAFLRGGPTPYVLSPPIVCAWRWGTPGRSSSRRGGPPIPAPQEPSPRGTASGSAAARS